MLRSTLQITEINGPLLSTLSNQFAPSVRGWFPGVRLNAELDCNRVRLWTRNGHDWSDRFPHHGAALRNHCSAFVIDGEAVLLGVDGRSDFNGLHSRKHDAEVQLYAFDCLVNRRRGRPQAAAELPEGQPGPAAGGPRRRHPPRRLRTGEIGPDLFRHACLLGLEGMVSKHRDSAYRGGRSDAGSRSRTGSIPRSAACWISSRRGDDR